MNGFRIPASLSIAAQIVLYGTGFCLERIFFECITVVTKLPSAEVDGGKFGTLVKARKPESVSFNISFGQQHAITFFLSK